MRASVQWRRSLFIFWCVAVCTRLNVRAAEPWDASPFSIEAKELYSAAAEVPFADDFGVKVLLESVSYRIDGEGRITKQLHRIYGVESEDAAREWATTEAEWSPWHQERPRIDARVIRATGEEFRLDPQTIVESATRQGDALVFRDERWLQAPLPGITAGSVVEEMIEWTDHAPFFAAGTFDQYHLGYFCDTHRARVTIEAPTSLTLHHELRGIPGEAVVTENDGFTKIVYDVGPIPGLKPGEPDQSPDNAVAPYVAFATGKSWQDIAKEYARSTEPRVDPEGVSAIVDEVLTGEETRDQAAAILLAKVRELVRYTGLEFGQSAIIPYSPKETLARRYGDCKDQSTLLVSMLRAAGYDACLALLNAESGEDVRPELPGLNAFNHAIVVIPGDDPLWIDPTSPYHAPGTLPLIDQGRRALIVHPDTTDLVRTPRTPAAENLFTESTTLDLSGVGGATVHLVLTWSGPGAADYRAHYAESRLTELQQAWRDYCENTFTSGEFVDLKFSDPLQTDEPFQVDVKFRNVDWGIVDATEAVVAVDAAEALTDLPWYLRSLEEEPAGDEPPDPYSGPRQHPLHWPVPHVRVSTFRVIPPDGYEPQSVPESVEESFGGASFSARYEQNGNTIVATCRFATGDDPLSPEEVTALREFVAPLCEQSASSAYTQELRWEHAAHKALVRGEFREALRQYRKLLADNPQHPLHSDNYVQSLLSMGFGSEARRIAEQAVEAMPESAEAYGSLGFALMHDEIGRQLRRGYDRPGALAAFRRAIELDPDNLLSRWNLAVLLEHSEHGHRYTPGEDLDEAIEIYQDFMESETPPDEVPNNLALCLYYSGRHRELKDFIVEHPEVSQELQVALVAIQSGMSAAKRKARSLVGSQFEPRLLLMAGVLLDRGQHYALARQAYEAGAKASGNPQGIRAIATSMEQLEHSTNGESETGPEYPVRQIFGILTSHGIDEDALAEWTVNAAYDSSELTIVERHMRSARLLGLQANSPVARQHDAAALVECAKDGREDIGYRMTLSGLDLPRTTFYVVPVESAEAETYQVLLSGRDHCEVGYHALSLLDEGRTEAAIQWLEWAAEASDFGSWFSNFSGSSFKRVWGVTNRDDMDDLKVAAAALAAPCAQDRGQLQILESAVDTAQSSGKKLQLQRALCTAYYVQKQDGKLMALAKPLTERYSAAAELRHQLLSSLSRQKEIETAEALASEWLKSESAGGEILSLAAADFANAQGHYTEAQRLLQRAFEDARKSPLLLNSLAWQALYIDDGWDEAIQHARQACDLSGHADPSHLHTFAAVLAASGDVTAAREALSQTLDSRSQGRMTPVDWYPVGRMAEHCGLMEAAIDAYSRAAANDSGSDTARLARLRLSALSEEQTP